MNQSRRTFTYSSLTRHRESQRLDGILESFYFFLLADLKNNDGFFTLTSVFGVYKDINLCYFDQMAYKFVAIWS